MVCLAWAHTCGSKSRCELLTLSKVKRNGVRVTERGKEAWSLNRAPMNKNRIEGDAKQREQANSCKALVTKARRRSCGGCARKVCDSYLGRSRPVGCSVAYAMTDASVDSSTRFLGLGLRGLASINASTPPSVMAF